MLKASKYFTAFVLTLLSLYILVATVYDLPRFGFLSKKTHVSNQNNKIPSIPENTKEEHALNLLFYGDIPKFNPISPDGLYVWQLQALIWDRLIEVDRNKVWHPSLAQAWVFNKDQTQLRLSLKPDIKWSNGRSLSAQDILFSLNFFKIQSLKGALFKPLLERIESFDFNNSQLLLKLSENKNQNPTYATHIYWSEILSSLRVLPYDLQTNPYLGTGLYKVESFSSSRPWSLVLNPQSWLLESDSSYRWPDVIKIKTFKAASVLESALKTFVESKSPGLTLGADLVQIDLDPEMLFQQPFEDRIFHKAIRFNLKKVPLKIRKQLESFVLEYNDLQKMNLVKKYRDFLNFNTNNNPMITGEFKRTLELPKTLHQKKVYKKFKESDLTSIEVLYTHQEDSQWLSYLAEKLKFEGFKLEPKLVSSAVFNEYIFDRKFEAFVTDYDFESFYPLYLSYHSKGEYNHEGWSSPLIDKHLEDLNFVKDNEAKTQILKKIRIEMNENYFEIPIFSYKNSVLWTRNVCNPIQPQFQGLGLIYKVIICADNL